MAAFWKRQDSRKPTNHLFDPDMKTSKALIPLLATLIIVMWSASAIFAFRTYGKPDNPGVWGDTFGAINSLFSGLALAGVVYAILLQRQELENQRRASDASSAQLAEQNRVITQQLATMQQAYEFERQRAAAEAAPALRLESYGGLRTSRLLHFRNTGGRIVSMRAEATAGCVVNLSQREGIQTNNDFKADVNRMAAEDFPNEVALSIQCTDTLGNIRVFFYRLISDPRGIRIEQRGGNYG